MEIETSSGNPSGLSTSEVAILRGHLERAHREAKARLLRQQAVATEADPFTEALDAAEQTREQDDAVESVERDRALLWEIEHALAKMDAGTYGVSELSSEPIGFPRLDAVPWARVTADESEE
ncbi:MAG TPA: TraR/DksA family transcriptional regulator [Polyangia bacterium]|nr:TraR/DksA family transcriptional regulator [Polyangia bacterium]